MSEKVVLPKFDLPGSGPHPAVRALWIVGGLLGVAMLVLGGAMWKHHAAEEALALEAQQAKEHAVAQAAQAKQEKTDEAAKLEAAAKARQHPSQAGQAAPAAVTAGGQPAVAAADAHKHAAKTSGHHHAAKASAKGSVLAKSDSHGKAAPLSKKKGDDAIDKLLASFK